MAGVLDDVLSNIRGLQTKLSEIREILLSNLVMISEIPAPTFDEHDRMQFLLNRFTEYQLPNCSFDEMGNAYGILPGSEGEKNILVVAHLDSNVDRKIDHTVTIQPNYVTGPGVGDNALGVAVIASLPEILQKLQIELKSNLILMGSARSLGQGDIEGLRFFLKNTEMPISAGVCVEGVKLGRISYTSIGMMRCEISYTVPEEYDWTRFGAVGAIITLNEVINKILEIPLPKRPRTSIVLGSIEGGSAFDKIATEAKLRFEIRSESEGMVKEIGQKIENIAAELSSSSGAEVNFKIFARRRPGGIPFAHPMAMYTREIQKELKIKPRITPSTSELSAFIDENIPALTLGLTNGENMNQKNETIEIEPIYTGMVQLIGLLQAIDGGYADEH